ncbi:MAG: hypothetical protein SGBAC_002023 [Bacillariaceae sp.]
MNAQRKSKKDERQDVARQSVFHFPGFTSSSSDDEDPPRTVTSSANKKKRKLSARRVSSSGSWNKKKKPSTGCKVSISKIGNSSNHTESVRKKLAYVHSQDHAVWTKHSAPKLKHHAKEPKRVASIEIIQRPPTMCRISNSVVSTNAVFYRDPPQTFKPRHVLVQEELESPSSSMDFPASDDDDDENDDGPPPLSKWNQVRRNSHKKKKNCTLVSSILLLLAFVVPYFDMEPTAAIHKLQGVKNQDWKWAASPNHNVFLPKIINASNDGNCTSESSRSSSYFSFY